MILAYDTETTGLPDFKARSHDPAQPHIVQLALVQYSEYGVELCAETVLVRPDGWTISPEMTVIHGITHQRAMDEGIPEQDAIASFVLTQARASLRVAHNVGFDDRIARIAMTRAGMQRDFIEHIESRPSFDTCRAAQKIVNLPPTAPMMAKGMTGSKPPKLEEAYQHFFGEPLVGGHDALVDARACGRIYWHLKSLERSK